MKYKAKWAYAVTPQNIPLGATGTENNSLTGITYTEYCGNYVYENGVLKKILTPEGYVSTMGSVPLNYINLWKHNYLLKDHLGNTRRVLMSNMLSSTSTVLNTLTQPIDYYPFGMEVTQVSDPNTIGSSYLAGATIPYLYNGKEADRMHGLYSYDYGARWRDGAIPGWRTPDPLCEKNYDISPYNFCHNNPVNRIDPDGMFDLETYTDEQLKEMNLTRTDYDRLQQIVNNISNIVNDKVIEVISNTTGLSKEEIIKQLKPESGTIKISLNPTETAAHGNLKDGIVLSPSLIGYLGKLQNNGDEYAQYQAVGIALTILHEFGHVGDQMTNTINGVGYNTGQYLNGTNYTEIEAFSGKNNLYRGNQSWNNGMSGTGHRGDDVEILGFGLKSATYIQSDRGAVDFGKVKGVPNGEYSGIPMQKLYLKLLTPVK